jgi:hypothetical protein
VEQAIKVIEEEIVRCRQALEETRLRMRESQNVIAAGKERESQLGAKILELVNATQKLQGYPLVRRA